MHLAGGDSDLPQKEGRVLSKFQATPSLLTEENARLTTLIVQTNETILIADIAVDRGDAGMVELDITSWITTDCQGFTIPDFENGAVLTADQEP